MVRGIPDHSAIPSVFMNYQSTQTITSPTSEVNHPWEMDVTLLPNPVVFSAIMAATEDGVVKFVNHLNPQVTGATIQDKYLAWKAMAQRWRLAYASATVYQDASALANQGTVVVAQYEMRPSTASFAPAWFSSVGGSVGVNTRVTSRPLHYYNQADWATGAVAQSMPNAYFGNSKEGCYVPLKLTETCQDWVSEADDCTHGGMILNNPGTYDPTYDAYKQYCIAYMGTHGALENPNQIALFPYWDETLFPAPSYSEYSIPWCETGISGLGGIGRAANGITVPEMQASVATISFRNLDPSARITIFYRFGWELQVQPGTVLTPQQSLSPRYDAQALNAYFAIARDMKDAYPADYNDLGKIWDVISTIGKTVLPVVTAINPAIGGVAGGILGLGNTVRGLTMKKVLASGVEAGKNPPPKAAAEAAAKALSAVTAQSLAAARSRIGGVLAPRSRAPKAKRARAKKQRTKPQFGPAPAPAAVAKAVANAVTQAVTQLKITRP